MTTSVGSVVQVPFKGDVVTKKLGCGRRVGSTSCVWKEADDDRKVRGSGEDVFSRRESTRRQEDRDRNAATR